MKSPVPVLMMVRELDIGGIERDVSKLARHIDRSLFEPHVASYLPFGARFRELATAGIPVLHLPMASLVGKSTVASALRLRRYVNRNGIRILHAFDMPTDVFAIPLARLLRIPVTVSGQLWVHPVHPAWIARLLVYTYRISSGVYVNCQAVKKQLVEEKGVDARRIHVCHNGVETGIFHPPREARAPDSPVVIGCVAVLRPVKDLPTLIEAFARVHRKHPATTLVIAGSGPVAPDLESRRRRLNLEAACRFLPPPGNVAELMRTMDIFVSSSLSEAFSNSVLEAMACGCSVVGSRVGGTPELIEDGVRGLLFEPGNVDDLAAKLCLLVEDPALRRSHAAAAAAFARETLNVHVASARLAAIYTELLGSVE